MKNLLRRAADSEVTIWVVFGLYAGFVAALVFGASGSSFSLWERPRRTRLRFEGCGAKHGSVVVAGARPGDLCDVETSATTCVVYAPNLARVDAPDDPSRPCVVVSEVR